MNCLVTSLDTSKRRGQADQLDLIMSRASKLQDKAKECGLEARTLQIQINHAGLSKMTMTRSITCEIRNERQLTDKIKSLLDDSSDSDDTTSLNNAYTGVGLNQSTNYLPCLR